MNSLTENEQLPLKEGVQNILNSIDYRLSTVKNTGLSLIIFNVVVILTLSIVLLNQMIKGQSFSHVYFFLSTMIFIVLISLSIILLLFSIAKVINSKMILFENFKGEGPLDKTIEQLFISTSKSLGFIKAGISLTSISTILYGFLILWLYFKII